MEEREISLVDLMIDILLHWRGIVILMVVGGILLGGYSYARSAQSAQEQAAKVEELKNMDVNSGEVLERMRGVLTQAELDSVGDALYYEELSREKEAYLEQSILLGLDPDTAKKATIIFLVKTDSFERLYNLEKVYEDLVEGSELLEKMCVVSGESPSLTREIYSLSRKSGDMTGMSSGANITLEYGRESDSFAVSILHYDEKMCLELAQVVIDYVDEKHKELVGELGAHEIVVLDQMLGAVGERKILQTREGVKKEFLAARNEAERLKGAFSEAARQYYDLLISDEDEGDEESVVVDEVSVPAARVSLKYVLLGMVSAAFVYVFIIFMLYVLNNKLRDTDKLQELYGIPQLGQITDGKRKKRIFGFVDNWILALRYWNQRKFAPEEALNLAAVAVKMAAGKEALGAVCLMGCDLKGQALESCEQMKTILDKENVEVQILSNILYDAEAMGKLEHVKGAVLVEKAGSTLYTEIAQELELLKRQGIKVLGGIIVG